jgi:hypothetical protein
MRSRKEFTKRLATRVLLSKGAIVTRAVFMTEEKYSKFHPRLSLVTAKGEQAGCKALQSSRSNLTHPQIHLLEDFRLSFPDGNHIQHRQRLYPDWHRNKNQQ